MKTRAEPPGFGGVYRASALLGIAGLLACLSAGSLEAAIGWTAGAAVSIGTLWSLELVVRRNFVPDNPRAGRALARVSVLKLAAAIALMSALLAAGGRSFTLVGAFCAGVILAQTVLVIREVRVGRARG